ncbi:kinase-like domain-containing protein [Bisporella sp. PMI_857]|nr:kinase-like domain-containing protein [Bisporella sp. PMI_857]
MDKVAAIQGLLDEGLTDEHLPLSFADHEGLVSCNGAKIFPFVGWSHASTTDFIQHKQWLVLAPHLDTTGQLIKVNHDCALPFTKSTVIGSGAAGIVHRAKLHPAHQRGFEAEVVDLQVAVKQFLHKRDFTKENKILQQIKALQHRHIIRHLASIDKDEKGYIIFPWADGGNLQKFWMDGEQGPYRKRALWAIRQMLGLTTAVELLHKQFKCRHGDLKPGNILCVKEDGEMVLKIADFGVSRIHQDPTFYRNSATTSAFLTPSYQGPEVEFEKVDKKDQHPRSRKYDIWSLGCVFLEFSIWLLHGPKAVEGFATTRVGGSSSTDRSAPLYEVTNKASKTARVCQLVSWTIKSLQDHPQCKGETALAALLNLIKDKMLQPEVDKRPWAADICKELEKILQEAEKRHSYLSPSYDGLSIPPLKFEEFYSVPGLH